MRTEGSAKLSYAIINKICSTPTLWVKDPENECKKIEVTNVTDLELKLLLDLTLLQDQFGHIKDFDAKSFSLRHNCSIQSYYNARDGLELKEYIRVVPQKPDDMQILDNMFRDENEDTKGYFNTNKEFLFSKEFQDLKVNEKKLAIQLAIKYNAVDRANFGLKIGVETLAKMIGIKTVSLIYKYMESLHYLFPNYRKKTEAGSFIYIDKEINDYKNTYTASERETFLEHKIKQFCRFFKINYTMADLKDLIILLGQYASYNKGLLTSVVLDVLIKKKSIEPALINKTFTIRYSELAGA